MSAEPPLNIYTLPLFPLNHVLFPQFPIDLHIFEERYKAMINGCIERNEPFGVVLIREGAETGDPAHPHDIGCVAHILRVERFQDGRMNLRAAGAERFRLLDYVEADLPYLLGRVEPLEDEPYAERDMEPIRAELETLFRRYLQLLADRADMEMPELDLPEEPALLSFCVGSIAQISHEEQQDLLAMTDTRMRIETEIHVLEMLIGSLESVSPKAEQTENQPHVVIAVPLDRSEPHWRRYHHEARN